MNIKTLKAQNFYSFRSLEIDFSKYSGVINVVGRNSDSGGSNGAGKSAIFESLVYALFGKTIRKSTEDALVNCDARKNLLVELHVEKEGVGEAVITRGKKPAMLNFSVNGQDYTKENATKTQEEIEKVLGINYKTFIASIVFGQQVDVDFLSATAEDKRTIIRNFLNLEEVFNLRDNIRVLKSDFSQTIKTSETLLSEFQKQRASLETKLINGVEKVILTETYDEVQKRENYIRNRETTWRAHLGAIDQLEIRIRELNKEISKGPYCIVDKCKTCSKKYTKKLTEYGVKKIKKSIASLEKEKASILDKAASIVKSVKEDKEKITCKRWIELKSKQDLYLSQESIKGELEAVNNKISDKDKIKQEAEVNYEVMRFWEKAFSEQGIIKYFIRNILTYLNFKTNEYLSLLTNNQFTITFNEELEEKITNNGRQIQYISLSGGEKRKVNLAVMIALQGLLSYTAKEQSDLVFMDEVAENIDSESSASIHTLLRRICEDGKKVFVITHNKYLQDYLADCSIITVIKKNGESKLQD